MDVLIISVRIVVFLPVICVDDVHE
jgi:hypothetical protein